MTRLQERNLAVVQRSIKRSLLGNAIKDQIPHEIIRYKTKGDDIKRGSEPHARTLGRTCGQNEQRQVGQDKDSVDT